jgi:hypothetical protein
MKPEEIDWGSGSVAFWDLAFLDPKKPLPEQIDDLKEDLAQAHFHGGIVLDAGWFPSFSEDGAFVVRVVRETDWDDPLFLEKSKTVAGLLASIRRAVVIAAAASTA